MASRKLEDLSPEMRVMAISFLAHCRVEGIDLLVTCTARSNAEQAQLYAQGRTAPGRRVTNARPGESAHNVTGEGGKAAAEALDVVPLRGGKPVWEDTDPIWLRVGEIGKSVGMKWGGDWQTFKEYPHFQNQTWEAPH
jgi:peptidoglycan L-alanyl-D-glutamate endopeptidase CwlK